MSNSLHNPRYASKRVGELHETARKLARQANDTRLPDNLRKIAVTLFYRLTDIIEKMDGFVK